VRTGHSTAAGAAAFVVALAGGSIGVASAHPLDPALLELREVAAGRFDVVWQVPRAASEPLEPILPASCRADSAPQASENERSITWRTRVSCGGRDLTGERVAVRGLASNRDALLRLALTDGSVTEAVLRAERPWLAIPPRSGQSGVMQVAEEGGALATDLARGVEQLVEGTEQVLFATGLLLLACGRREIVRTVAAFAVASSIGVTAACLLGATGRWEAAAGRPALDLLIAAGTLLAALGLARRELAPALARASTGGCGLRAPALALGFGMLHGVALSSGLGAGPGGEPTPLAVLAFNAGIELGLLGVAGVVLLLRATPLRRSRAASWVSAYGIGSVAAFWLVEQLATLLRAAY
jgi:hypothetical protein